jgi:putative NADH-flavin reductase
MMMKLIVLGATGGTGLEIVRQAIARGHSVTAFVRSAERLKSFGERITVKQGDPLDPAELERVIQGHDAIVSGFGPRLPISKNDANLLQRFAASVTRAMWNAGVRRVVVDSIFPPTHLAGRLFFPETVADASAMERIFAESRFEWTMVRPPRLTDRPYTGKYRVREGHLPRFGFSISRADVADCLIRIAEDGTYAGKVLGASN